MFIQNTKEKFPNSPVYVISDKGVKALIVVEWIKYTEFNL